MALELLFLGTGTSAGVPMIGCNCPVCASTDPRDRRMRSSVLVRYPRTLPVTPPAPAPDLVQILIDASPDIRPQAIRHGLAWLDAIMLTHSHADHILGIDDLRRFNAVMDRPLDLFAEPTVIEQLRQMFGYIFEPHTNVNQSFVAHIIPFPINPNETRPIDHATWTPIRLLHGRLPILGFRVDWHGRSLAYCTDVSSIPPSTFNDLANLDLLVIDGLRHRHHPTHMTIERACEMAQQIGARQTLLTHIAHDIAHATVDPTLPDGINLATDGLRVVLEAQTDAVQMLPASADDLPRI